MLARVNFKPARPRIPSRARLAGGVVPVVNGLIFPSNGAANSDIRLVWSSTNLLSRTSHTALWRANYVDQSGFYAVTWHSPNTGSWDFGAYSCGMHPYPTDGVINSSGDAVNDSTGATGHWFEIAGLLVAGDFIASPSSPGPQDLFPVTKGIWYSQARVVEVISGTTVRHTFYPDVDGQPTKFIRQEIALSGLDSGGSSPAFYFGASDWTASGNTNGETPSCTLRSIRLFNAPLSIADIQTEFSASASGTNAAASTAGQAATWYINDNPTPTDVSDKSSAGHSPSWANANRPTLYTG